jgi:HEPN domain-containing protein
MECYSKAKEAYRMGKKNVATFYAQQVKRKTGYSSFINCDI